jgi:hypothetical protein
MIGTTSKLALAAALAQQPAPALAKPPSGLWLPAKPAIIKAERKLVTPDTPPLGAMFMMAKMAHLNGGGQVAAVAMFTAASADTVDGTSDRTFTSISIGTVSADRYIAVFCTATDDGGGNPLIGSCTVSSQSTTGVQNQQHGLKARCRLFITDAPVTSGSTATIVVGGLGGAVDNVGIMVYALTKLQSNVSTGGAILQGGGTTTLTVSAGGVIIGGACTHHTSGTPTSTPTGLTEDNDSTIEGSNSQHCGSHASAAGETNRTVGHTISASTSVAQVFAAFR